MKLVDDQRCFVCGMENLEGLRIKWTYEGLTTSAQVIIEPKYQGWQGIVHGGIVTTLLDEAMTRLACVLYGSALTAEITVRFVAPAKIGELLLIRGEIVRNLRKIVEMKAEIRASDQLLAHAVAKAIKKERLH